MASRRRGRPRNSGAVPSRPPREDILRAAGRLFAQHGYAATSTTDIADAVGLTQPAIFYYFDSKEDLFAELANEALDEPLAELERIAATDASPAAKLYRLITFQVTHDLASPHPLTALSDDVRRLAVQGGLDDVMRKTRKYARDVMQIVSDGMDKGQFRRSDPFVAAMAILGMTNWTTRWFRRRGKLSAADVGDGFAEFALTALLCDPDEMDAIRAEAASEAFVSPATRP